MFVRRPGQVVAGATVLGCMAILVEVDAAANEGPMRHYFAPGLTLWGWLAGLIYARMLGAKSQTHGPWMEKQAEMGAVAALAANYVDAVLSKLTHVGTQWADDTTLRAIVLSHHTIADTSLPGRYAAWVGENADVAHALSVATLVVQGGAILLLWGGWVRVVAALAIVGFHTNVQLLAEIGYAPARTALLLLCVPWPLLLPRAWLRRPPLAWLWGQADDRTGPAVASQALLRVAGFGILATVTCVLAAQQLGVAHYASFHHGHNPTRVTHGGESFGDTGAPALSVPPPVAPPPAPPTPAGAAKGHVDLFPAAPDVPVPPYLRSELARAAADGRRLLVYVGATWCEPCRRFHDAAKAGQLDADFGDLRLVEFDLDRDRDRLAASGYASQMIPLLALPAPSGESTGRGMQGSIKGEGAVENMRVRLKELLAAPAQPGGVP